MGRGAGRPICPSLTQTITVKPKWEGKGGRGGRILIPAGRRTHPTPTWTRNQTYNHIFNLGVLLTTTPLHACFLSFARPFPPLSRFNHTPHPAPYTLHPTPCPYTPHPAPYTLCPMPCPCTCPAPCTQHPAPHTLCPVPYRVPEASGDESLGREHARARARGEGVLTTTPLHACFLSFARPFPPLSRFKQLLTRQWIGDQRMQIGLRRPSGSTFQ